MGLVPSCSPECVFESQGINGWPGGPDWCAHCDCVMEDHQIIPDDQRQLVDSTRHNTRRD